MMALSRGCESSGERMNSPFYILTPMIFFYPLARICSYASSERAMCSLLEAMNRISSVTCNSVGGSRSLEPTSLPKEYNVLGRI